MEKFRGELTRFIDGLYEGERKTLVHGEGRLGARVMLIGEAPGEQETLQGRPFVGKAGKNLDEFLELAGIDRAELYVSNTVKFRPTKISDAGRTVNRPPTQEEVHLFLPWLKKEIDMVNPECVVTLGNVPLRALTGDKSTIGDMHGAWHTAVNGLPLFALYHPAAIIYRRELLSVYEQDVCSLRDSLTIQTQK